MKTLYLLRHAKTEAATGNQEDIDRRLTASGREACEAIGSYMKKHKYVPSFVLSSPARRTSETFSHVMEAAGMSPPYKFEKTFYPFNPDRVADSIRKLDDNIDSVMIVGHNPGIHQLAITLAKPDDTDSYEQLKTKYPTGTLTVLRFKLDSWERMGNKGGKLMDFMPPSET